MWTKINNHFKPDCLLCHQKTITIEDKCFFPRFKCSRQFSISNLVSLNLTAFGNESIQLLQAALLASNSTEHMKWQVVAACRFFVVASHKLCKRVLMLNHQVHQSCNFQSNIEVFSLPIYQNMHSAIC